MAETYSKQIGKGKKGGRYTIHERVDGQQVGRRGTSLATNNVALDPLKGRGGRILNDVIDHPENTIRQADGSEKIIDFLPAPTKSIEEYNLGTGLWKQNPHEQRLRALVNRRQGNMGAWYAQGPVSDPDMAAARARLSRKLDAQEAYLDRRQRARVFRNLMGARTQPSDFTPQGIRRADQVGALRGL